MALRYPQWQTGLNFVLSGLVGNFELVGQPIYRQLLEVVKIHVVRDRVVHKWA